jgi:hypothetical protein
MALNGQGFGFILRDHDSIGAALARDIRGAYLNVNGRLFPLEDIQNRYRNVVILDEMVAVADGYEVVYEVGEDDIVASDNDWKIFDRLFVKRCTVQNVLVAVKQSLARIATSDKDELSQARADALVDFEIAVDAYIDNM